MACLKFSPYFPESERATPCGGRVLILPKFYAIGGDGPGDAAICTAHADWYLGYASRTFSQRTPAYLRDRIIETRAEGKQ